MKFEIDDKTGILLIRRGPNINSVDKPALSNTIELEHILQSVKKTQEKILNKQIQEIQDSKNTEYDPLAKYDPWEKSRFSPSSKAEQNQKIVDGIVMRHNYLKVEVERMMKSHQTTVEGSPDDKIGIRLIDEYLKEMGKLKKIINDATGKDIKDL